jgi:AraC-like DNA-binding protein
MYGDRCRQTVVEMVTARPRPTKDVRLEAMGDDWEEIMTAELRRYIEEEERRFKEYENADGNAPQESFEAESGEVRDHESPEISRNFEKTLEEISRSLEAIRKTLKDTLKAQMVMMRRLEEDGRRQKTRDERDERLQRAAWESKSRKQRKSEIRQRRDEKVRDEEEKRARRAREWMNKRFGV